MMDLSWSAYLFFDFSIALSGSSLFWFWYIGSGIVDKIQGIPLDNSMHVAQGHNPKKRGRDVTVDGSCH